MTLKIIESFFDGINRTVSRDEFFNPKQLYSAQNVRILQSGRIGEIVRIKGYQSISESLSDLSELYDMIRTHDNIVTFYKNNSDNYVIKVFNSSGTLIETFTYTDDVIPTYGQLKQYDDSLFVSPHNKILYEKDGNYFLENFISKITSIDDIGVSLDNAGIAQYNITINETLDGFEGRPSMGIVRILRNNIPQGVKSATFKIRIGNDTSTEIEAVGKTRYDIHNDIVSAVNSSPEFSGKWTAKRHYSEVHITSDTIGSSNNGIEVDVVDATYIKHASTTREDMRDLTPRERQNYVPDITPYTPYDFVGELSRMAETVDTFGGLDAETISGSLNVILKDAIATDSINITDSDTTTDIASKIESVLQASVFVREKYNITRSTNTITITARKVGKKYNTDVLININDEGNFEIDLPDNFYTVSQTAEGSDDYVTGTLEVDTTYWYTARFRYVDGHVTSTCSPKIANSDANGIIGVTFDVDVEDLDGGLPRLQIFRKKENEDFFLIQEVNLNDVTITGGKYKFEDDGRSRIEPLVEVYPTWTKEHDAQEVMDNRLLKGNLKFFDESLDDLDAGDFTLTSSAVNDDLQRDVAPYNSRALVYARPQYTDGTLGFFKEVGDVTIENESREINVQQTSVVNHPQKDISEFRFYSKYLPFGEEQNYEFNTIEIQNQHIAGIADPTLYPTQTKIFFGYKYITVIDNDTSKKAFVYTRAWQEREDIYRFVGNVGNNRTLRMVGDKLIANIHGTTQSYVPVAVADTTSSTTTIYKLEVFDALEEAVSTGSLYVRLSRTNRQVMSSIIPDDDLTQLNVRVTGIDDKTLGTEQYFYNLVMPSEEMFDFIGVLPRNLFFPPEDCRIYLVLETSNLDEIDNQQINKRDDVLQPSRLPLNVNGTVAFNIINFQEKEAAVFDLNDTFRVRTEKGDYDKVDYNTGTKSNATYLLINRDLSKEEDVIYLGSKPNEIDSTPVKLQTTGFRFKRRSLLDYSVLAPYNIYDTLIKESDFNFKRTDFPCQIIWSNPLLENNYFSGGRNYETNNFYNLPTENGDILDIVSLGGNLYAFCERGVARLLVGEVLTQQKSGQVFVDSTGFITKHIWLMEKTSPIKRDSICKKDGSVYWTDGTDVYRIGGDGIENISQGALLLDENVDYFATTVSFYDEYRLSTPQGEMFVYNTKYKKWYGPHTYTPSKTVEVDGNIISYVDGLVQEDVGNTFDGTAYDSVIESVGNDTEVGAIDKTYRKFYMDVEGEENTTFSYGKTFSTPQDKDLTDAKKKNGYYNIGVKGSEGNSKKIYWKFTSQNEDFALKGFRTAYNLKRRRR